MATTDHNKPTGKPGQRSRKAEQRTRKSDRQQGPKADQQREIREQTDATVGSTDTSRTGAVGLADVSSTAALAPADTPSTSAVTPVDAPSTVAVAPADAPSIGAVAPADDFPVSIQTIANAYSDYTRKSLEETTSFVEKLTGVRSLDKAIELQAEFAKQAYETFVAESQRICELYSELAKQIFKPFAGLLVKTHSGR